MVEKEGRVKDLVEKLKKGEITSEEVLQELKKRKLVEKQRWEIIPWVIWFILILPFNIMFPDQLPAIRFPLFIICISIVLSGVGMYIGICSIRIHYKIGGLKDE